MSISRLFLGLILLSLSELLELPRFLEGLSGLYGLPTSKVTKTTLVAWNHTKILDICQ